MHHTEWRDYGICIGLICGTTLGTLSAVFLKIPLVYGIASGALLGYIIGMAVLLREQRRIQNKERGHEHE